MFHGVRLLKDTLEVSITSKSANSPLKTFIQIDIKKYIFFTGNLI